MHLSETALGRLHHASRTPIREALSRLSEDGYVEWAPRHGFVIAPVTVSMVRNTFQLRRILEGAAAAIAAHTATPGEAEQMHQLAEYHYSSGSSSSYRNSLARNLDFHLALAKASHNDLLVDMVRYCLMHFDRILSLGADFKPFEEGSSEEHHSITEAVERHDAARARRRIENHLDRTGRLIMDNVMRGTIRGVTL
jgi:DNA-binding GntR family transcriptional regulator